MQSRTALPEGTLLAFPGLPCVVGREMGRGSNAIVYRGWYADALDSERRHYVLIKELFPYDERGAVYRDPNDLSVRCGEGADGVFDMHARSFTWGNDVHLRVRERYPAQVSGNINTYPLNNTYYTVLDLSGGRTLESCLDEAGEPMPLRALAQRMAGVLDALSVFHEMGYLHLDISPDNILLIERGALTQAELIDYNSVARLSDIRQGERLRFSMKKGYTSPEIRTQAIGSIGAWTDLYSVAAVFYRCLTGHTLSNMQLSGIVSADMGDAPCLRDAPETVRSLARQIVAKGLCAVPEKRYRSAAEMQTDFAELADRIDGVGVTHWALWEAACQGVRRIVRRNPALRYLTDDDALFPIDAGAPEGDGMRAFLRGGHNVLLTGDGGMGKTTLLLRAAWLESRTYRKDRPVALYLPLYGAQTENPNYLYDSLLQRLRFKADTGGYENARHALHALLQKPLGGQKGDMPALCLLLDGYNEVSGDTAHLRREIARLAEAPGVRVLVTSRSDAPELGLEAWRIQPLAEAFVARALGENGLLVPKTPQMLSLLANPMMLSLFINACRDSGRQIQAQTQEELVSAYLDALLDKEIRALPDGSPEKWRLEAAVRFVCPMAAGLETRKRRGVTGVELAAMLRALYALPGKRSFGALFPGWIGHAADIRGGAKDSDAWFGVMIHDLLWRRMGLLVQDENGAYRVAHQALREALLPMERRVRRLLVRRRLLRVALPALLIAGLAVFAVLAVPTRAAPYQADVAIELMSYSQNLYSEMDAALSSVQELLNSDSPDGEAPMPFSYESLTAKRVTFDSARDELQRSYVRIALDRDGDGDVEAECGALVGALYESGGRFPWSDASFDGERFADMVRLRFEAARRYEGYIEQLETVYRNGTPEQYAHMRALVADVLAADASRMAAYEYVVYTRRVEGMLDWESSSEGEAHAGAYRRMSTLGEDCRLLSAYAQAEWKEMSGEEMLAQISRADKEAQAAQEALARDLTYKRLKTQ